ncbi:MAG: L-lysine 6-transaminase, partial [Thermoplasmata archaeon]|nr:L-lysine 6-transaminase [Thermoplasmata archaeon]
MVDPKQVHEILKKHVLADGYDLVLDMEKSHGMHIHDSRYDRTFLDFFSFFASSPLGMNHPRMSDPEFSRNIGRIARSKPTNGDIYTPEYAEFVETFASIAPPDLPHHFYVSGGALGVENALKAAFDWKWRKNVAEGMEGCEGGVIHLEEAFHGRTGYTLSLTNTFQKEKIMYFPKFDWPRVSNPKITFPLEGENLENAIEAEEKSLSQIREAIDKHGKQLSAFIMEPIQAEGGDNHFRPEYFQAVRKLCDEHDLFFILDEVQSGMGITGKWWAYQHYGFKPDAIAFGKKSQTCGCCVSKRVEDVEDNVFKISSRINSTWGGNLVDMVRATQYIKIMKEERLLENAAKEGKRLLERLHEMATTHPMMSNPRGKGLMCAFDLPTTEDRNRFNKEAYKQGLLI